MGGKVPRLYLDKFILRIIYKKARIYREKYRQPAQQEKTYHNYRPLCSGQPLPPFRPSVYPLFPAPAFSSSCFFFGSSASLIFPTFRKKSACFRLFFHIFPAHAYPKGKNHRPYRRRKPHPPIAEVNAFRPFQRNAKDKCKRKTKAQHTCGPCLSSFSCFYSFCRFMDAKPQNTPYKYPEPAIAYCKSIPLQIQYIRQPPDSRKRQRRLQSHPLSSHPYLLLRFL